MTASLTDAIAISKGKLSDAQATKAALGESSGKAEGELAETKKTKIADELFLKTHKLDCENAAKEWAARQKSANGEIAAIEKAKEILTSRVKVLVQVGADDPYEGAPEDDSAE